MFNSQAYGVSTVDMKSTKSWVTPTMYSFAPMPSNGGISSVGSFSCFTARPQPECAKPVTAPCDLAQRKIGMPQLGHSSMRLVPGKSSSFKPSRQMWPVWLDGNPETSTSYRIRFSLVESTLSLPSKNVFWKYQLGPQLSTEPIFKSSPRMCRHHVLRVDAFGRLLVMGAA